MRPLINVFSSRNCGLTVVTACILNFSWHPQTVHCFNMKHTIFTFNSTLSFCPETLQGMKPTILKQSHPPTLICDCSLGKNQTLTYSYQMVVFFLCWFSPHGSEKSLWEKPTDEQTQTQVGATAVSAHFDPRCFPWKPAKGSVESCCHKYLAQWWCCTPQQDWGVFLPPYNSGFRVRVYYPMTCGDALLCGKWFS